MFLTENVVQAGDKYTDSVKQRFNFFQILLFHIDTVWDLINKVWITGSVSDFNKKPNVLSEEKSINF